MNMDNNQIRVGFKKLTNDATLPVKAHRTDSGFDLFANEDAFLFPGVTKIVKTGIAVVLPKGYEAQVRPRSGVTSRTKLRVQLGTIDQGYTGEIGIIVDNTTPDKNVLMNEYVIHDVEGNNISENGLDCEAGMAYQIKKGDKLAQLVIQKVPEIEMYEIDELPKTKRGSGGFGSTGF